MATTDYSLERGLPVSMEAERSILGAILLDNSLYDQAAENLVPDHFSLDAHRRIYSRMRDLQETGRPVDMITLVEELDRRKEVEAIGGVAYLSSLIDGVPDRPSIEHYVRIVRNKALLRGLINVAQNAIAEAIEHTDEAEEVLGRAEQAIFQLSENRIGQGFMDIPGIIKSSFGSLEELYARGQEITGLATHYTLLDKLTSGLQPSDLVIVAARPSMGKTAFAMNIAENAAVIDGKVVGVFSLEMSREALLMRMLASHAQVDSKNLRQGFLTKDDMRKLTQAVEQLTQSKIHIDDTPGISVSEMRAKARRLRQQEGLDLIIVDYLQLMSAVPDRRQALRKPHPGSVCYIARTESAGQGVEGTGHRALPAQSRSGKPRRRSSPTALRPARVRIHRAGRRPGGFHLPRRGLQERRSRPRRYRRAHHRQAAQRPDRHDTNGVHQALHPL